MLILSDGSLSERITTDPRWSQAQREAAEKVAAKDPAARVTGLDQRMRPVVACTLDGPGSTTYALLRNGDPAKPIMPLSETWRGPRR